MASIVIKPAKLPWVVQKGSTVNKTLTWFEDEARTQRVDLTGFTARMKIKDKKNNVIFNLTTEDVTPNPHILLGDADGTVTIFISDADTAAVTGSKHVYDLELIAGTGEVIPWIGGSFTFTEEVTD